MREAMGRFTTPRNIALALVATGALAAGSQLVCGSDKNRMSALPAATHTDLLVFDSNQALIDTKSASVPEVPTLKKALTITMKLDTVPVPPNLVSQLDNNKEARQPPKSNHDMSDEYSTFGAVPVSDPGSFANIDLFRIRDEIQSHYNRMGSGCMDAYPSSTASVYVEENGQAYQADVSYRPGSGELRVRDPYLAERHGAGGSNAPPTHYQQSGPPKADISDNTFYAFFDGRQYELTPKPFYEELYSDKEVLLTIPTDVKEPKPVTCPN